jgi:hypothetical protein
VDSIKSQLDQLAELGDEAITELADNMVAEFDRFASEEQTSDNVAAMTELADMLDTVRGEMTRRETMAVELTQQAAEAAMRVKGEDMPSEEVVPAEEAEDAEKAPMADEAKEDEMTKYSVDETPIEAEDESEASVDEEAVAEASVEVHERAEASNSGDREDGEAVVEAAPVVEAVAEAAPVAPEAAADSDKKE